jgi:heptosyltransferase-2
MKVGGRILIIGVNWLGDACMSMPALSAFRRAYPTTHISLLIKPKLADLWGMSKDVDDLILLEGGVAGTWLSARRLRGRFDRCYILPNSWRSALIPFLAGISMRVGTCGHHRGRLLTHLVNLPAAVVAGHQSLEYSCILDVTDAVSPQGQLPVEALVPPALDDASSALLGAALAAEKPLVAMLPGAARGPSKQWPVAHYQQLARDLVTRYDARILMLGTPAEEALCNEIAAAIGPAAIDGSGRTSLPQLAALLSRCATVVCNDSGGMHLAAVVGSPVVAIFGMTDPVKTGPVGQGHALVLAENVTRSRDISRDSAEAVRALASVGCDRVLTAVGSILDAAATGAGR